MSGRAARTSDRTTRRLVLVTMSACFALSCGEGSRPQGGMIPRAVAAALAVSRPRIVLPPPLMAGESIRCPLVEGGPLRPVILIDADTKGTLLVRDGPNRYEMPATSCERPSIFPTDTGDRVACLMINPRPQNGETGQRPPLRIELGRVAEVDESGLYVELSGRAPELIPPSACVLLAAPQDAAGLAGRYDVVDPTAAPPGDEVVFVPQLDIRRDGEVYRLRWFFGMEREPEGVGLLVDRRLLVGWSADAAAGLTVYEIASSGELIGEWVGPGDHAVGRESAERIEPAVEPSAEPAEEPAAEAAVGGDPPDDAAAEPATAEVVDDIGQQEVSEALAEDPTSRWAGSYRVQGTSAGGIAYEAELTVEPIEGADGFQLSWRFPDGSVQSGIGFVEDELLVAGFIEGEQTARIPGVAAYALEPDALVGRWLNAELDSGLETLFLRP